MVQALRDVYDGRYVRDVGTAGGLHLEWTGRLGLLAGQTWARVVGIAFAVLAAVANFAFLPYYPFWSILVIAFNILVIWASPFAKGS